MFDIRYMSIIYRLSDISFSGTLSADEWEAAYLYMSFVLRKRGQPDKNRVSGRKDRGLMHITEEDITYIGNDF